MLARTYFRWTHSELTYRSITTDTVVLQNYGVAVLYSARYIRCLVFIKSNAGTIEISVLICREASIDMDRQIPRGRKCERRAQQQNKARFQL